MSAAKKKFFKWLLIASVITAVILLRRSFYPVFIGIVFALVLNAPVKFFEKTLFKSDKLKKIKRTLSLSLTLLITAGVITGVVFLLYPGVESSIEVLSGKLPSLTARHISGLFKNNTFLSDTLLRFEIPINNMILRLNDVLPTILLEAFTGTANVLLGLFFGLLIILNKERLAKQLYGVILYFTDKLRARKIMAALGTAADKFSKFMSGQLVEALIFGLMCYITFLLFGIPYAPLAALILAVGNIIPMLGSYVAGAVGFIIIFTISADKAIAFLIIVIVLQQIEQFTTYPLIVGRYVGISSFWILFAVTVGGSLFGFWGLLLGVPFVAFLDNLYSVLRRKEMTENSV